MNVAFIFASAMALLFMVVAFLAFRALVKARAQLSHYEVERAVTASQNESAQDLRNQLQAAIDARIAAEKQVSIEQEKSRHVLERMQMHEKTIEEMKQAAKASVMEAGAQMSTKLLEDHKREMEAAKKESEKLAHKTTETLMENFSKLTQSVTAIQTREQATSKQVETVMRALTNPGGAGHLSEIGLENSLKNLGLVSGQDFFMQYHTSSDEGGNFRPDAVIRLPQDMVMVIDSKASKFMLELAQAEGTEREAEVMKQLIASMHSHIRALSQKQYADEVERMMKKQGIAVGLRFNVMYLPSDAAIEKLRKADPSIAEKCEKANLFMAGPASLAALFSLANQQISAAKRDANQQHIISQLREVMGSFATALMHVDGVGKNIQGAAKKFDAFAKSINTRLLPKLRHIENLGVQSSKPMPLAIKSYDVIDRDQDVSAEAVEVDELLAIDDKMSA